MRKQASILDWPKKGLSSQIWNEDSTLKPEVKQFILDFIHSFAQANNLKHLDQWVDLIQFVGSLTTNTYNNVSDADIHLHTDLSKFVELEHPEMSEKEAHEYLDEIRKKIDQVKVKIPNTEHPVELFFETPLVTPRSFEWSGLYSILDGKWIESPHFVEEDFDVSLLYSDLLNVAKETASELDETFGDIKREISDIKDLEETIINWPKGQRDSFEKKLEKKLNDLEGEIKEAVDKREDIVEKRKHYKALSQQEITMKYLSRYFYMNVLTDLKTLLKQSPELTVKDIPVVENIMNQANLKLAYQEEENRILVDMDDTICHETSDNECGEPMEGVKEALTKLKEMGYEIVIFSHRADDKHGEDEIKKYLEVHEIPYDSIYKGEKPLARFQIDDRAIHFDNWNSVLKQIEKSDKKANLNIEAIDAIDAYYHGGSGASIRQMAKDGYVMAPLETGRRYQSPLFGRTYLTKDLGHALIYALEGNMVGMDISDLADRPRFQGEGGIVLVAPKEDTLIPDEDWLGEKLCTGYEKMQRREPDNDSVFEQLTQIPILRPVFDRMSKARDLWDMAFQSMIGKMAIRILLKSYPEFLKRLAKESQSLSHEGNLKVLKAWVFDKQRDNPKLKKDGSNFFEVAQEIPVTSGNLVHASLSSKYWIDPDGEEYPVKGEGHYGWVFYNFLAQGDEEYETLSPEAEFAAEEKTKELISQDWTRITTGYESSDNSDFAMEVADLKHLPSYLDNFAAKHFEGKGIEIDDLGGHYVKVIDPFPSLQKAVNKALQRKRLQQANFKEAQATPEEVAQLNQTLMIDFDATIAHENPDCSIGEPMKGVKEALTELKNQGYTIVINSHRGNTEQGQDEIKEFMDKHEIPYNEIYHGDKPLAFRYIDDRAIQFTSWSDVLKQVEKAENKKEASLSSKYWIDPSGKEYEFGTKLGHYGFVMKMLGIDPFKPHTDEEQIKVEEQSEKMLKEGWSRITPEGSGQFAIEVYSLENLPQYLDNFIAKHFDQSEAEKGWHIELDDHEGSFVQLLDPFPTIQQAVNKKLSQQMSVTPRAALSKKDGAFNPYNDESLKQGPAYAVYIGEVPGFDEVPPLKLYNIFGDHPRFGSTVSEKTLQELGIPIRQDKQAQLGSEYDYSSTHFLLPKELAEKIVRWAVENIPEDQIVHDSKDPGTKGVQLESHITLKYGLLTDDFEEIKKALEGEKAPHIKFNKTSFFEPDGKDYDVVIIPVESENLQKLNEKLCSQVKHEDLQFKEYHPHVTVAYVKKSLGKKYAGKDIITGEEIYLDKLTFSPKEGEKRELELHKKASGSIYRAFNPHNPDMPETLVYRNPTLEQFTNLYNDSVMGLRYFVANNGDMWVWDSLELIHQDVMEQLGYDKYKDAGQVEDDKTFKKFIKLYFPKTDKESSFMPSNTDLTPSDDWAGTVGYPTNEAMDEPQNKSDEETWYSPENDRPRTKTFWQKMLSLFKKPLSKKEPKNIVPVKEASSVKGYFLGPQNQLVDVKNMHHEDAAPKLLKQPIQKLLMEGWVTLRIVDNSIYIGVRDIKNIPNTVDNYLAGHKFNTISVGPYDGPLYTPEVPQTTYEDAIEYGIQKAINRDIVDMQQPMNKKEIMPVKEAEVEKEAGGYWLDPSGAVHVLEEGQSHSDFIEQIEDNHEGWTRITTDTQTGGFGATVDDLRKVPIFVFDFLLKNAPENIVIIEDFLGENWVELSKEELIQGQKAVNKALQQKRMQTAKQAKQWTTPKEPINQPGMDWQWADYIYNYVEKNWQDFLLGWLELDPKNYVKPIVLIEKIYADEGSVSAWVHVDFVNKAAQSDAFIKMIISADIHYEPSYEPEGVETHEYLDNWETEVLDYGVADSLEKDSSYGPTNYQGPSVADHGYQNSAWDDMNVTYSPEEDEELMDQNGKGGYPNRWMSRHRGPYYTNEGKVVKMLEETSAALSKKDIEKKAIGPMSGWLAPDGKWFVVNNSHDTWIDNNLTLLEKIYKLPVGELKTPQVIEGGNWIGWLISHGWARVDGYVPSELDFQIADIKNPPKSIESLVWRYNPKVVILEDLQHNDIALDDFSEGLDSALRNPVANLKIKAALSGETVNNILNLIHQNGGATWNISKGNLVGQPYFAVAVYPEKEQIVPEADFENLEGYLVNNESLLNNPNNSFGAWASGGKVYYDVVATIADKNKAMELGKRNKQLAIFDLKNLVEIPLQRMASLKEASWEGGWIDPMGQFYKTNDHEHFIKSNPAMFGLTKDDIYAMNDEAIFSAAYGEGWTRVRNFGNVLLVEALTLRYAKNADMFVHEYLDSGVVNIELILEDEQRQYTAHVEDFKEIGWDAFSKAQSVQVAAAAVSDAEQQAYYDQIFSDRWRDSSDPIDGGFEYNKGWSELNGNDFPAPKDLDKERALLDQLEKPIDRNNPVGLGEYAITYYDAFPAEGDKGGI